MGTKIYGSLYIRKWSNVTKNLKGFVLSIGHVDSCVESCQMCVIRRGWHGHTPRAPGIHVAQLVSELLQAVGGKVIVVI